MAQTEQERVAVDLSQEIGGEPWWMELRPGVQLQVLPAEGWMFDAAESYASKRVEERRQAHDEMDDAGIDIDSPMDIRDIHALKGYSGQAWSEGLARQVVVDWTGVGEDGAKAEVTKDRIVQLMRIRNYGHLFKSKYLEDLSRVWAEGNGSGASPSGTSATAPTTAEGAGTKTSPARKGGKASTGKGARTSKTG